MTPEFHSRRNKCQGRHPKDAQNVKVDIQVDAQPIEVDTPDISTEENELYDLPADDVYLDGWNMSVTIDFSLKGEFDETEVEMSLVRNGQQLEIMKTTQTSILFLNHILISFLLLEGAI